MLNPKTVTEAKTLLRHVQMTRGTWTRPGNASAHPLISHIDDRHRDKSEDERLVILVQEIRFLYEATQRNTEGNAQIARLVTLGEAIAAELREQGVSVDG